MYFLLYSPGASLICQVDFIDIFYSKVVLMFYLFFLFHLIYLKILHQTIKLTLQINVKFKWFHTYAIPWPDPTPLTPPQRSSVCKSTPMSLACHPVLADVRGKENRRAPMLSVQPAPTCWSHDLVVVLLINYIDEMNNYINSNLSHPLSHNSYDIIYMYIYIRTYKLLG